MKTTAIIAIVVVIVLAAGLFLLMGGRGPTPSTTTIPMATTTPPVTTIPPIPHIPTEELSLQDAWDDFEGITDGALEIPTETEVIVGELEPGTFELTL